MDYTTLIAAKTTAGSILHYSPYAKASPTVILSEAEALIYSRLRVREMRAWSLIALAQYAHTAALPTGFLEPITMRDREGFEVIPDRYINEAALLARRNFDPDLYTTLNGTINAAVTALVVADYSEFPSSGSFSIMIDSEAMLVTAGAGTLNWTVTRGFGGTTAAAHTSGATVDGALEDGTPSHVAVFNELFQFDCKADEARKLDLAFYKTPTALGASNTTNFLTSRYPNILRVGCQAGAASFEKDEEYEKKLAELVGLIEAANAESDLGRAA